MDHDLPEELVKLYVLRRETLEKAQDFTRAAAEALLTSVFAHATSPEVLPLLGPLLSPWLMPASAGQAGPAPAASEPGLSPEAEKPPEALAAPAPEAIGSEPLSETGARPPSETEASLSDPFAGLPDEDWLAEELEAEDVDDLEAEEVEPPALAAAASESEPEARPEPESEAAAGGLGAAPAASRLDSLERLEAERLRAQQEREALLLSRQLERIQACQNPEELIELYQSATVAAIKQQIGARLQAVFRLRLAHAGGIEPLLALLSRIPARLPAELRQDMLEQLSERWESYAYAELARADGIEGLAAQMPRLVEFWELCEPLDFHPLAVERVYLELCKQWLNLAADEAELQSLELPPLFVVINDEPRQILSQPELRQEARLAWEALIQQRLLEADSLRALKTLYHSQDWDAHYRPARKMILKTWNELTTRALAEAESFAELGAVVRSGGSPIALQRWIDTAESWEELTQVYTSVDVLARNSRPFTQLVEKIMLQADSEERIREAHSLMRSHTLDWLMGHKDRE